MFDIGFSEMMVIAVVALVVIGPEKLPRVARTVGAYLGRLQRYVNDVKADINREIELDELRKFKQEVEDTARGFESSVREEIHKTETEFNQVAQDLAGTSPSTSEVPVTAEQSALAAGASDATPAGSNDLLAGASSGVTGAPGVPPAPTPVAAPSADPAVAATAGASSPAPTSAPASTPSPASDVGAKRAA